MLLVCLYIMELLVHDRVHPRVEVLDSLPRFRGHHHADHRRQLANDRTVVPPYGRLDVQVDVLAGRAFEAEGA
jgi:hypothetical protein